MTLKETIITDGLTEDLPSLGDRILLERKLDDTFGDTYFGFTFRKILHGISDHNVYPASQISLLKRLISFRRNASRAPSRGAHLKHILIILSI